MLRDDGRVAVAAARVGRTITRGVGVTPLSGVAVAATNVWVGMSFAGDGAATVLVGELVAVAIGPRSVVGAARLVPTSSGRSGGNSAPPLGMTI
ncbi:MAG: hypothetical protein M3R06_03370 [Chloroflexota bacterium]|nr:hypothetical protein [Chloroflexota bacterium]